MSNFALQLWVILFYNKQPQGCIISIIAVLGLTFVMYVIDCLAPCLSYLPHNLSGDTWFGVLASVFSTAGGIIMSLLAMYQTQRLNDLQMKLQRPSFFLKHIEFSEIFLKWNSTADVIAAMPGDMQYVVEEYGDRCSSASSALMGVSLEMSLKNNISVNKIDVLEVILECGKDKIKFVKGKIEGFDETDLEQFNVFTKEFVNGIEQYIIKSYLINFFPIDDRDWEKLADVMNETYGKKFSCDFKLEVEFEGETTRKEELILRTVLGEQKEEGPVERKAYATDGGFFYKNV